MIPVESFQHWSTLKAPTGPRLRRAVSFVTRPARMLSVALGVVGLAVSVATLSTPAAWAQTTGSGTVTGRVQSAASGNFLNNARVRATGTNIEVFTNSFGEYRVMGLPPGPHTLEVFYTGMSVQRVVVTVPATGVVEQDVVLRTTADAKQGDTVVMSQFVVSTERETDAAAIAINEQRFAPNRMDVVSTDAFGQINQGNIGEFVKFLPGISLDVKDGNIPSGIMIRGFDPNYTNVTLDGGQMASTIIANTQTSSRQFVLENANINNLARIEVVKLPTPEMSANLLGGAVNFVSRNAFERPRRELRISSYLSANSKALEFKSTPGPLNDSTYKILPSLDIQFADPVSKRFGYVVVFAHSSQYYLQNKSVLGHNFRTAGATIDNPYTTNVAFSFAPNRTDRTSGGVNLDFKPWDRNVLKLNLQASASKQQSASRTLNYNVGGTQPISWDMHNTFGAATGGSAGMGTSFQERHSLTRSIQGSWEFRGDNWKADVAATYSNANNRTRDTTKGFFRSVSVALPNVAKVNIEGVDSSTANIGRATVLNAAGQPIDELNLANFRLRSTASEPLNAVDVMKEARGSVSRTLTVRNIPINVKIGGNILDSTRDLDYQPAGWTYVGPDGVENSADDTMGAFISQADLGVSAGFGSKAPQWPDAFKVYQSFKTQPSYWTQTVGQQGDMPRNYAIRSPWFHETITAGFLQADTKLLNNRLRIVAGTRYELTEDEGWGRLQDTDAVYLKDAQGNTVYTVNPSTGAKTAVIRPELLPTNSYAYNVLAYKYRGYYASRDYSYWHPSAHVTFNLTENLLLRAAYAKTIGRPNISDVVPYLNVSENINYGVSGQGNSSIPGFISGADTGLKPWTAKNYDYSIEYYLPRNGVVMFNWYRKDIRDFFSTITQIADQPLLDLLGLDSSALGYQWSRRVNISDARITGWEARIDLPLANLAAWGPLGFFGESWAKHISVTGNMTHLDLSGSRITSADWRRYIPRGRNVGIRYNFPKVSGNLLLNWRGRMLRDGSSIVTGSSADASEYIRARYQFDGDIAYQINKRFSVFAAGRNLLNAPSEWEVTGRNPTTGVSTPKWSALTNYEDYGPQYSLGVKATF